MVFGILCWWLLAAKIEKRLTTTLADRLKYHKERNENVSTIPIITSKFRGPQSYNVWSLKIYNPDGTLVSQQPMDLKAEYPEFQDSQWVLAKRIFATLNYNGQELTLTNEGQQVYKSTIPFEYEISNGYMHPKNICVEGVVTYGDYCKHQQIIPDESISESTIVPNVEWRCDGNIKSLVVLN